MYKALISARDFVIGRISLISGKFMLRELKIKGLMNAKLSGYSEFFVPSLAFKI